MIIQSKIQNPKPVLSKVEVSKIVWLAFTLIILIAFFFRFYRLAGHPLGIFFDPAINGLDTVRLMQRGGHPIFIPTNGGREAFFMYLLIPFIRLFDPTPFAIRALTATISLLTVALLFGFLKSIGFLDSRTARDHPARQSPNSNAYLQTSPLRLAALAGLTLAVSYWHIAIGRMGVRAVLVTFLSVPMFWFFLKGWATGQKRWFVVSGFLMGLAGHTYSTARLLPLILVLAVLPEFLPSPGPSLKRRGTRQITNLLIFILTALLIYLPIGWYLLTYPAQFTGRAFSVMVWNFLDTPGDIIAEIGRNILRVLGFFCCAGSPNPIFGLPGYPGLPFLLAPFLLIGLMNTLKNWRRLFDRLIALWWLIGLTPSIIAIEAPHPLRMIVAVVPTAILVALGLIHVSNWLRERLGVQGSEFRVHAATSTPPEARRRRHASERASRIIPQIPQIPQRAQVAQVARAHHASRITHHASRWLPLILILLPIPNLFRAYFIDWTNLQATQGVYDYGAIAIRDTILEHPDDNVPIYLPQSRFNDSTLLFYLSGSFQRQAASATLPADSVLVIASEKNEKDTTWVRLQNQVATVLPPLTAEGQQLIQNAFAGNTTSIQTTSGETIARLASLSTDPAHFLQQPTRHLAASFGPARLTGINYAMVIDASAGEIPVTLFWQTTTQMTDEYEVILHLVDDNRQSWGDGSGRPTDWVYPTTFWRPGLDEIAAQHNITVETDSLAPGRYWLALSLFDPAPQQRLPLTEGESDSPDTLFIGPLKVSLPPVESPGGEYILKEKVTFGDVARLSGFATNQLTVTAGEPVNFSLVWEALSTPSLDFTVFVHLLDANDDVVAGHDTQPLGGRYPTSIWTPGERVLDPHTLPTPDSLPAGQYRLAIGLYDQPTGERLPLNIDDNPSDPAGRFILNQPVTVRKTP